MINASSLRTQLYRKYEAVNKPDET